MVSCLFSVQLFPAGAQANVPRISHQQRHTFQVPANLDTVENMDRLNELLLAVGCVLATSVSPVHLAVACMVVWKLAESAGESVRSKNRVGAAEVGRIQRLVTILTEMLHLSHVPVWFVVILP